MASEKQYAFFQYLFEQERDRGSRLNDYGKNIIALVTGYSGFVLFVTEKMQDRLGDFWLKLLFLAVVGMMLASLIMAIRATGLETYQVLNDPENVRAEFDQYEDAPMSDDAFFDNRIADATEATNFNGAVNDDKANGLAAAAYLLAAGIILHAVFFVVALF